jgi:hypothetical protein
MATEYSRNIYNKMMATFGWEEQYYGGKINVMEYAHLFATGNKNGKLTILLLDIKDFYGKNGNESYVAGYFLPSDLFSPDSFSSDDYKTNQRDMIYIDTNPGIQGGNIDSACNTIAHEMQHLMNYVSSFYYRQFLENGELNYNIMDTWIDEGLSSAAEWVYREHSDPKRIEWYNADKSGLIAEGNNFFVWGNREEDSQYAILDDYSTVYLFFQWLRIQSNKKDIYKEIITSTKFDHEAVTDAIGMGTWEGVLGDWLAANYINDSNPTGKYGYKNEPGFEKLEKHYVPITKNSISLYPGEGVYSYVKTQVIKAPTVGTPTINYIGLSDTNVAFPINTGGALLTYNTNTVFTINIDGSVDSVPETGTITGEAPSVGIAKSVSGSGGQGSTIKGPFPIGMGDVLRRNGHGAGFNKINIKLPEKTTGE